MLPVKEFPYVHAGGVQAKTTTGVGVKDNGPVVELLTEQDVRVNYGSVTVVHRPEGLKQYSCQERHH
jgi:uncharacterized protein YigE (DUF2233 family)